MNDPETGQGQLELAALLAMLTLSDGEVAQALGVSPITIRSWRTGRRSPTSENRESLVASARAHAQGILKLALDLERRGASDDAAKAETAFGSGPAGGTPRNHDELSSAVSDPI